MRRQIQLVLGLVAASGCAQLIGAGFDDATLAADAGVDAQADNSVERDTGAALPDGGAGDVTDAEPLFDARAQGDILFWVAADFGVDAGPPDVASPPVSSWLDQSGKLHDLSQGAPARQPTFVADAQAGLPVVRFERQRGTCLTAPFGGFTGQGGLTLFVVARGTPSSAVRFQGLQPGFVAYPWERGDAGTSEAGADLFFAVATPGESRRVRAPFGAELSVGTARLEVAKLGGMQAYKNGVLIEQTSFFEDAMPFVDGLSVGCLSTLTDLADGEIAEILVYGSALPPDARARVESYLKHKWAIP